MLGGAGGDTYYVDNSADFADESAGQGNDTIIAATHYTLTANVEALQLVGAALYGNGNDDANTIVGNGSDNELRGLGGDDAITGGGGYDLLYGGSGADRFIFTAASDSTLANLDAIIDFEIGVDKVDVSAVRAGASDTFAFTTSNGDTFLHVDIGGDGSDDMLILFYQTTGVTDADLIWG